VPSSHDIPRIPLRTVGPYQLTAQLGQSTHGPAYIARIPGNDTTFALKWFQRRIPPEEVARIRQEIQIVSRLNHPGIVVPVDFGLEKDRLYIVSEHVEGSTAQERLSTHGPMDGRDAARLVADLADALERAHQAGILHRDLKPANVILDSRNRGRILDLGLGPSVSAAGTNTTPYQAPEQIRGERPGVRTDVYALGAILYELLCCRPPYSGRSTQELADTILAGQLIPPRRLTAGIDPKVESICLSALSANPRKRPSSAGAMAKSLRRAAEGGGGGVPILLVALVGLIWLLSLAIPITLAVKYNNKFVHTQSVSESKAAEHKEELANLEREVTRANSRAEQAEHAQRRLKDDRDRKTAEAGDLNRKVQQITAKLKELSDANQQLSVQSLQPLGQTAVVLDTVLRILEGLESVEADRLRVDLLRARGRYEQSADLARALRTGPDTDYDLVMSEYLSCVHAGNAPRLGELVVELEKAPEGHPALEFAALARKTPDKQELIQAFANRVMKNGTSGNRYLDLFSLVAFIPPPQQRTNQQMSQALVIINKLLPAVSKSDPLDPSFHQSAMLYHGQVYVQALQQKKRNQMTQAFQQLSGTMQLARELQPDNLRLIVTHAERFLQLGQAGQAHGLFEVAILRGGTLGDSELRNRARLGKGTSLLMQKRVDEGLREWKGVFASFPTPLTQREMQLMYSVMNLGFRLVPQDRLQALVTQEVPPHVAEGFKQLVQLERQRQQQQQQRQQPPR